MKFKPISKKTISTFLLLIHTAVFSQNITLPETLIQKNETVKTVISDVSFGEGPALDSSGSLYFTDRNPSRIRKVTSDGNATVYRNPANGANGLVFDSKNRLIVCEKDGITRVESDSTTTQLLKESTNTLGNEGPNDLSLTSDGGIFFTSSDWNGTGRLLYLSPSGELKTLAVFQAMNYANGVEYIEEKQLLYLCLTQSNKVVKYNVNSDMSISEAGTLCNVNSPDGLAIDNNGNLWIAASDQGAGVTVFDTLENKLGKVGISDQSVQNCAFGGESQKTLFITGKTAIYSIVTVVGGRSTTGDITKVNYRIRRTKTSGYLSNSNSAVIAWSLDGRCAAVLNLPLGASNAHIQSFIRSNLPNGMYIVSRSGSRNSLSHSQLFTISK